jgi:hypothetical protein
VGKLFVDPQYEEWHTRQDAKMRTTSREMKQLALSDAFWRINEAFVAIEETAETSLRILDSDQPNLKDAAFAFFRIKHELQEPLLGKLATIPDWDCIDLRLELETELLGDLPAFLLEKLERRKADWLSEPVLAAACVNAIYLYSSDEEAHWDFAKSRDCERAVAAVIKKLLWGDSGEVFDMLPQIQRNAGALFFDGFALPLHASLDPVGVAQQITERFKMDNVQYNIRVVATPASIAESSPVNLDCIAQGRSALRMLCDACPRIKQAVLKATA